MVRKRLSTSSNAATATAATRVAALKQSRLTVPDGSVKSAKGRRHHRRNRNNSYATYIYKVLKQVHPETGISKSAMTVMDNLLRDVFERLADESSRLVQHAKKQTLTSRDMQTATRMILRGELAKHAVSEGTKALTKFKATA